ncbi:MAG: PAS domain S-box protein [Pseudomonadota bacterium]
MARGRIGGSAIAADDDVERQGLETLLMQILDSTPDAMVIVDCDGRIQLINRQLEDLFGYARDELLDQPVEILLPERLAAGHVHLRQAYAVDPQPREMGSGHELVGRRKDGGEVPIEVSLSPVRSEGQKLVAAALRDITERKRMVRVLQASHQRFEDFANIAADWFWETNADLRFIYLSDRFEEVTGQAPQAILGSPYCTLLDQVDLTPGGRRLVERTLRQRLGFQNINFTLNRPNGDRSIMSISGEPVADASGRFLGYRGVARDVTRQRELDEALRTSEARLTALFDHSPASIHFADRNRRYVMLNRHWETLAGVPAVEAVGRKPEEILPVEVADQLVDHAKKVIETGEIQERRQTWRHDGGKRIYLTLKFPVQDDDGTITGIGAIGTDITELEHAEAKLRESHAELEERVEERTRELARQQEELRQAQKMETLGQLTGGVAHDFNNLLTAVMGNLEMLEARIGDDEAARSMVNAAQEAASLGADLTGRLLAFARRQPLDPKRIALNDVVLDMSDLLARTLGENVRIDTVLANPLDPMTTDPSQLRNALLNLAINARDAMPNGGQLTIETANVELDEDYARERFDVKAGCHVMLAVSDTGLGMPPEVRERVFEPFFTTKDVGKGSGLGLSMVYGFVKQSGGHIRLYSEVGHGTTVGLYWPKATDLAAETERPHDGTTMPRAQRETVLVVEDDPRVMQVTVQRLKTLGYMVLEAKTAAAALDALAASSDVDLVFSDVVMPGGLSGSDLAQVIRQSYPSIKVLLTSGYSRHAGIETEAIDGDMPWLQKPYRMADLAQRIREVLDG